MATTPNKALTEPANGSLNWDVPLNANFTNLDQALGGTQAFNLGGASGTVNVSGSVFVGSYPSNTASYVPLIWSLSGTLTSNVNLQIPSTVSGQWIIANSCTGSFTVTISTAAGGTTVGVGNGTVVTVAGNSSGIFVANNSSAGGPVGSVIIWPGASLLSNYFYCDGAAISRTTYASLYSAIGTTWGIGDGSTTFNLPNLNGVAVAGADNMGGTAANVIPGLDLGVILGSATHTQLVTEMPSHTHVDSGHTHSASDSGHTHPISQAGGTTLGAVGASTFWANSNSGNTGTGVAHITVATGTANNADTGGGSPFTIVQPTAGVNYLIRYQ